MLNIRNKVKLLLIFILLTSSNHYAFDLDINVTSNYISNQFVRANNSWWETITSFFGLNKKEKVNNNSQDIPSTTSSPHIKSVPNTNDNSTKNSEQTQETLDKQVNKVIRATNYPPNKDTSTVDTSDNLSTSFINLDSNTLPKVNDNNPVGNNNDDIELPDLPEEIAESKASESKSKQDFLAVNNHHNLQANINQNSKDEQQTLNTASENIVPNYERKYTPIRRSTILQNQEILKLVQPLAPKPATRDNNQIKSDFEQNDHNNLVSIDNQKEAVASSQISPLQSDNPGSAHQSVPIEPTNSNTTPTQTDLSTQEFHTDIDQIVNVRDGNDNEDSSSAIDHISIAEHANAAAGNNTLDSTDHNSTNDTQDDKELDQKIIESNNNIYNPIDSKDDAKNNDRNIINNVKSTIDPQIEQSASSNATSPISDKKEIATDSKGVIANSEKIYDSITQSDLHTEQGQKLPATTVQSSSPTDKSLEPSQEQEVNTTELLHSSIVKSNQKVDNVNIDIFINQELIDLAKNDNNDMVLGSLTRDAEIILMDDSEYSKMIEQKLEYRRESQNLQGVNNIINYHHSKINRSKKQKNNLQFQRQTLSQAYRSIEKNEINNLRTILDYYHIINLLDADGNSLLHMAAKYNNYTLSKLLMFKGSNVDVSNNDGFTPLAIAIMNNDKDLLHLLYTIKQMQQ